MFVWLTKRMLSNFSAEVVWAIVVGFFIGVAVCVWWDRFVCRLCADPDKLKWWQAPAKDFIAVEKVDYTQAPLPERRVAIEHLPPAAD